MRIDDDGLRAIMNFEGTVLHVYIDAAGIPTIGTGHALTAQEIANRSFEGGVTKDVAREILRQDVANAEAAVTRMVKVPLEQHQFNALVSFVFNVGSSAFYTSTLLQKLNAGDYDAVPPELTRWCKRKDPRTGQLVVDNGLLARRRAEGTIWSSGHDSEDTKVAVAAADVGEAASRAFGLVIEAGDILPELTEHSA